jgi:addiction module HigA family antidote
MSSSWIITEENDAMMPVHPGRILKRELAARELSANRLALSLRLPSGRITDILNGKRGISPETALRLARFFGNSARFWLNLQTAYELAVTEEAIGERVMNEVQPDAA